MTTKQVQDKVIEEIGEVLQAIGKYNRFGADNFHPDRPESSNKEELIKEIDDAIMILIEYQEALNK